MKRLSKGYTSIRHCISLTIALTMTLIFISFCSSAQKGQWVRNFGLEFGGDFAFKTIGLSSLTASQDHPLINSDLQRNYAATAGFYAEFLKLHQRTGSQWGNTMPGFGIKTGVGWSFFRADNSNNGGGESLGFNFVTIPLFAEYCIGYKQGVTTASSTPGSSVYTGRRNYDGSVTVTENYTPGTYNPGGAKTSSGTIIYMGPQINYLIKSFNYTGDPIVDPNLQNNYVCWVGGIVFWLHQISFDFSYQKGLTSIYNGKDLTIDGFMMKIGINFKRRLYN